MISKYDKMGNGSFRMNQPKYFQQRDVEVLIMLKFAWDICLHRIVSIVLGEEDVNRDLLLKGKVTMIWLKMKT